MARCIATNIHKNGFSFTGGTLCRGGACAAVRRAGHAYVLVEILICVARIITGTIFPEMESYIAREAP